MVKTQILRGLETKKNCAAFNSLTDFNNGYKSWNIFYNNSFGTTGSGPNQRMGDEIYCQNIEVRFQWTNPQTGVGGNPPVTSGMGPYFIRYMVISADEFNTVTNISTPFRTDLNTNGYSATSSYIGPVDTDKYTVLYDKMIEVEPQIESINVNGLAKFIRFNVPLKRKLTFKGGATSELKTRNYYFLMAVVPPLLSASRQISAGGVFGSFYITFKDA